MSISIVVVTATRAEYGNLKPFIDELKKQDFEVRLVVTGSHLSSSYGMTIDEIKNDHMEINQEIPIMLDSDSPNSISKTMAIALSSFADYFSWNRPNALLVMGDRYEMLPICCAALNEQIPIIHLYGGETTEGAIDESIRHCITKMSLLHFTGTETYKKRVIQLGEDPSRVFNVGSVSVDNAKKIKLMTQSELAASLHIEIKNKVAILTYHPVTLEDDHGVLGAKELLKAIESYPQMTIIATKANADSGGRQINDLLTEYASHHDNFYLFDSLGLQRYMSALSIADLVIGNSSSGLTETAIYKVPTVNIGDRQKNRLHGKNVIDCGPDKSSIEFAIEKGLSMEFKEEIKHMPNPFGEGNAAETAASIIRTFLEKPVQLKKSFYDIEFSYETEVG